MKPRILPTTRLSFLLALAALFAAPAASATSLYWDIDDATADAGGTTPSGTWATGGTTWSTSPNGTVAIPGYTTLPADDLFFSAGTNATGAYTVTLTTTQDASSLTFQEGTATISGAGGVITLGGTGGKITVNNGAAAIIGATTDTVIGGSVGLTKIGVGTLTLNGTLANTFTGGLNVNGGTLALNFANMVTPTDLINNGNDLALGGGRLLVTGLTGAFTTNQTLGNVTVSSGGGRILGDKNGGTATNIILGTLATTASGGSLLAGAGGTAANAPVITTTSGTLANGIYSGRAVFFDGTANTGYDWLTNTGGAGPTYTLSALAGGSYTALDLTAGTDTNNSTISATAATTGSRETNSLKFATPATAQTLTNTGFTLTLGSGGLLFTGASVAQGPRIAGGSITAGNGSGSYDLVAHAFNATAQNVVAGVTGANLLLVTTISSDIVNNGVNAVTLVKNGPGSLVLSGATNTFSGGIVVNEGNLAFNTATAINNNAITFNANSIVHTFSGSTTSGIITLNNNSQVTILNNNSSFTITGKVTGTGGMTVDRGGQGSITLNLNATNNDFTGPLRYAHNQTNQSAHITVGSLADTTTLGEGNITFGVGTSSGTGTQNFYYGATAAAPLALTNRRFELAGVNLVQSINNASGQALTINSDLLVTGTTGKTLTLGGAGAGLSTFAGILSNSSAPATGTTPLALLYVTAASSITLASVTGISVGATITGTGIAVGTTITAINPYTRVVTLSVNTNATGAAGQTMTVTGVTNSIAVSKTGGGTWVLSSTNTYTGPTVIAASGGTLQLGDGGTAGSLSTSGVISIGTSGTFAVNQSDTITQGTDFSNAPIIGAGGFRQAGSGNTVLNQANTFSGASSVRNGTLTLDGGASRIGSTGSLVLGDTATTGKLILGGTTTTDQTLAGLTTTDLGGSVVGGNASNSTLTLTIAAVSTFGGTLGGAGTNENNLALTKSGASALTLANTNSYTGATTISAGLLIVAADGGLGSSSAGTTIAPNASLGLSGSINYSTAELISGSGPGPATISPFVGTRGFIQSASGSNTFSGNIELNADGLSRIGSQDGASLTLTGSITQASGITTANILFRVGSTAGDFVTLSNAGNSFGGDSTVFTGGTNTGYAGVRLGINDALPTNLTISGFSTTNASFTALDLAGYNQKLNGLITGGGALQIINQNTVTPSTLTLDPTADTSTTNTLILGDGGLGVIHVDKIGLFTQTLSGVNTYTGATTVSAGTLALVGGSQASPITVNNLASLGFTLGSGTTSTNTVTFNAGSTVKITGAPAPATSYTLLTTTATISGTPVLDAPISGFQLQVDGGNTLKLVPNPVAGYASWIDGFFPGETNLAIIGADADPDNDGIDNGVEMVIGGNPATGMDSALLPTIELVTDPVSTPAIPTGNYLLFTYRRSDLSVAGGVTAACETDTDLVGPWTTAIDGASGVVIQVDDNHIFTPPAAANTDRVRVYVPRGANTVLFGRLDVVVP